MDLLPTSEQEEIVSTVRSMLETDFGFNTLAAFDGKPSVIDRDLWTKCAELGWFGLGLTESLGGVGYTLAEEALLFTEVGAHATPGPFMATVLGARLAAMAGQTELTSEILAGEKIVALAEPHTTGGVATAAPTVSGTFRITDRASADLVLVMVGGTSALVDVSEMTAEAMPSIDMLVPISVGTVNDVEPIAYFERDPGLVVRANVLVAAELAGIATATAEQSTQYGMDREQFGTPIGAFQAVKHRCADMAVRAEAANSLVRYAALAVLEGLPDAAFHAHAARSLAASYAITNAQINVQNHGGIGFTWEHSAHRYVTRARVRAQTLGTVSTHLSALLGQPAPV